MTPTRGRATRRAAPAGGKTYVFRLFVAGHESNSIQARANLLRLCKEYLYGRHEITIVDVLKDATAAFQHHVLLTPTLMLVAPRPTVLLLGNLSDTKRVLAALRLNGIEP